MSGKTLQSWNNYDPSNQGLERVLMIRKMIPKNVKTILDAGCGNGIVCNNLASDFEVTATDISAEALLQVTCNQKLASITEMPFADAQFDLVMCNEVLEHLNNHDLQQGIAELKRLSSKYLIISVPHQEQLQKMNYKCAHCGNSEHVYGHIQSFSLDRLTALLSPQYTIIRHSIFGPKERNYFTPGLVIKQQLLNQWFAPPANYICSLCGQASFVSKSSLATKLLNALNLIVSYPRPYWLMVLFQKP